MRGLKAIGDAIIGTKGGSRSQIIKGSAWNLLGNALRQVSGLIRLLVLARFLSPEEFGLMAIIMMVLTVLETFTTPGFDQALIQRQGSIDHFFSSVFVANIVRGILLTLVIVISSPYIASFFHQEGFAIAISSSSIIILLRSFRNPALVRAHRSLEFRKIFIVDAISASSSLIVALMLAPVLRNVWVLIIAAVIQELSLVIGSYLVSKWKPRLSFDMSNVIELSKFGRWVVVGTIIVFLSLNIDKFVVGRILGPSALGKYEMAFLISQLPSTQISTVIAVVAYPVLSKLANDPVRFREAYLGIASALLGINLLLAIMLILLAEPIVLILLGPQWEDIVGILQVLTIAGFFRSLVAVGGRVMFAAGKPQYDPLVSAARFLVLAIALVPFARTSGLEGVSIAVALSSLIMVPIYLVLVRQILGISPVDHVQYPLRQLVHARTSTRTRNQ